MSDQTHTFYARFLLHQKNYFSIENKRVKAIAFMPAPSLKLSVFNIEGITDDNIWKIGKDYVAQPQSSTIKARADIEKNIISQQGLHINQDDNPPRHANIEGWPNVKHEQMAIAQFLAAHSSLHINNAG